MYKVHQKLCLYLSSIVRTELTSLWEESHKEGKAYIMGIEHSHEDESKPAFFFKKCNIRHFQISHNSPYLPPKKNCITFVFLSCWVLQPSQEKLKTALMQNFGRRIRCIMGNVEVAYSTKRESAICTFPITRLVCARHPSPKFFHNPCTLFPLGITFVPREIKDCLCKTRSFMEDVKIANYPV